MRDYPQSNLVHAAVKRIGRMHGGDVPKDAEGLWKQAMTVQKTADEKDKREQSRCGPECLAELLKRGEVGKKSSREDAKTQRELPQGRVEDVETLAAEMHTSGEGSSIAAMRETAAKHGLKLQGVSLTTKGLARQKLPLIALIAPGHYVLVDSIALSGLTVWDPDAKGVGVSGRRAYTAGEWEKAWNGVALRAAPGP